MFVTSEQGVWAVHETTMEEVEEDGMKVETKLEGVPERRAV